MLVLIGMLNKSFYLFYFKYFYIAQKSQEIEKIFKHLKMKLTSTFAS